MKVKTKKDAALDLIGQLIEDAAQEDTLFKQKCCGKGKGCDAQGESFMLHHLKALKELVKDI